MDPARTSCNAPLRFYRGKEGGFFHGGDIPPQLVEGCVRIRGYLFGAFARGAHFIIWDKHAFAEKSKDAKHPKFKQSYQVEYVEKLMRIFRKTTTEFKIEEVRWGRSPRLKITMLSRAAGCPISQVRGRLLGYIRGAVRIHGWARVDAAFISHFIQTTGAPAEIVASVWQGLKYVPGCRVRWKGCGANLKMVCSQVSLQQSSLSNSSPSGRRYEFKTMSPRATGRPGELSGATPLPVGAAARATGAPRGSPSKKRSRQTPPRPPDHPRPAGDGRQASISQSENRGPAPGSEHRTTAHAAAGWDPAGADPNGNPLRAATGAAGSATLELRQPFAIAGRWISGEKTFNLARWLAVEPLQAIHVDGVKVRWRFAHARNFACRALRSGHTVEALVAAYAAGVQRSHDDAGMAGETARDNAAREPSAAVNYAWRELFKDSRSREQRWAGIFAGERAPRRPRVRKPAAAPDPAVPAAPAPKVARRDRGVFAQLKSDLEQQRQAEGGELTAGELATFLESRHMTLADFTACPWTVKKRLVQAAINQRLPGTDNTK